MKVVMWMGRLSLKGSMGDLGGCCFATGPGKYVKKDSGCGRLSPWGPLVM
jgi:hypothetical protein